MHARTWPLIAALLLASQPAVAEDEPIVERYVARHLAGHRFVPSTLVDWGFVDTTFRSTSFAGLADFEFESDDPLGRVIGPGEVEIIGVLQRFSGALALTRWLGLSVGAEAFGAIPRNAFAAFQFGASTVYQAEAAALVRLFRHDRVQISARVELGWGETRSAIPARLPSAPFLTGDVGTVRPSVIAAVTLARWLGIQASGSYAWRHFELVQEDDVQTVEGAVAATFAINLLTLVVGFQISHDFNRDVTSTPSIALFGTDETHGRLEASLYYQGREDLDLGLGVVLESVDDSDTEKRGYAFVNVGYYF